MRKEGKGTNVLHHLYGLHRNEILECGLNLLNVYWLLCKIVLLFKPGILCCF